MGGANLLVDVNSFAVFSNAIGQLARAPMFGLLDFRAFFRASRLNAGEDLLDFVFRCGRTRDKNQIVQTLFHDDPLSFFSGREAR